MADVTVNTTVQFTNGSTHAISATGTKPFALKRTGGPSGAYDIVDANGKISNVRFDGQTATSVLASWRKANWDAIITALNA